MKNFAKNAANPKGANLGAANPAAANPKTPQNILITGGAGFIGSNFIAYFLQKHPEIRVFNLDLLTYAADLDNLKNIANHPRYRLIRGDICDQKMVQKIFRECEIDGVIHFAAETHVDNSIARPAAFVKTNIEGTFNLLSAAYLAWFDAPSRAKKHKSHARFLHISTDEVFGSIERGAFSEDSPYAPNSPYSASKAASDMLVRSYNRTYGLPTFITNCSNNFGPNQHSEKLIPTIVRSALSGREIPIYGDGENVRDWIFVLDHCRAVEMVFFSRHFGETFNIGGGQEMSNIALARAICAILDAALRPKTSFQKQIAFVKDRAGHDRRYAIDSRKMANLFGFATSDFYQNLTRTIEFYIARFAALRGGGRLSSLDSRLVLLLDSRRDLAPDSPDSRTATRRDSLDSHLDSPRFSAAPSHLSLRRAG